MVTAVLVLIAVLVIVRLLAAARDRSIDQDGVDLSRSTWDDHLPRRPGVPLWSGTTWDDGGWSDGASWDYGGGDGDFDSSDDGGGGDFGGGDSG